jgi:hypothetical protein
MVEKDPLPISLPHPPTPHVRRDEIAQDEAKLTQLAALVDASIDSLRAEVQLALGGPSPDSNSNPEAVAEAPVPAPSALTTDPALTEVKKLRIEKYITVIIFRRSARTRLTRWMTFMILVMMTLMLQH